MTAEAVAPTVVSPYLTVAQAAIYAGRNRESLYLALHEYVHSAGKRGLRGSQPGPRCSWRVLPADLEAWMAGERPAKRPGRAS
jgi:hypothetical protein